MAKHNPNLADHTYPDNVKLPVSEIFYSIQGEGKWIGTPAVFVRFCFCNLGCDWCDSDYTWDKKKINPQWMMLEEVAEKVLRTVPESVFEVNPENLYYSMKKSLM